MSLSGAAGLRNHSANISCKATSTCSQCLTRQSPQPLHQAPSIHRSQLIENDVARTLLESAPNSPREGTPTRRERCNDDSAQMRVQFIRRNDDARPCFLDLTAQRRIKPDEVHLATGHHQRHSVSSNSVGVVGSSRTSCPVRCIARALTAQPVRGREAADTTSRPGSAFSSTSSGRPASSRRSFRDANPPRVADTDDPGLGGQCDYSVITLA